MAQARALGWLVRKVQWLCRRGAPDRLFVREGVAVFVETKAKGKLLRLNQWHERTRLQQAGLVVRAVDNVQDGLRVLDNPHGPETLCEQRSRRRWEKARKTFCPTKGR